MIRHTRLLLPLAALVVLVRCGSSDSASPSNGNGGTGTSGSSAGGSTAAGGTGGGASLCPNDCFVAGDANGAADPTVAKAQSQARAGRITNPAWIRQPADARNRVQVGDFLLTNEKIALYISDARKTDGYVPFGGEIVAIDKVADDGIPAGLSEYGETLMAFSDEMVAPASVTVLNDGSDGNAAIVRAMGTTSEIPFLGGALKALFPDKFGMPIVVDYILKPGEEKASIRVGLQNTTSDDYDLSQDEMHGFFHSHRSAIFTAANGYNDPVAKAPFVAFDSGQWNFAWRKPGGATLNPAIGVSGFEYFIGPGFKLEAGATRFYDHAEIIAGGPYLDGLLEAIARTDGTPSARTVTGTVQDATGKPIAGAYVHELLADGTYKSRTVTAADGTFSIHAPADPVTLSATMRGYATASVQLSATDTQAGLAFAPNGTLHFTIKDADLGSAIPARVQVIPKTALDPIDSKWGVRTETNGRLHQDFPMHGDTTLPVPPGSYEVIVTRGYEYDVIDTTIDVAAGETKEVAANLQRSVDSTGWMCADYHIHSFYSVDAADVPTDKVLSAVADGLDIPISSEHEWVIDFQPIIEKLGVQQFAFGMPSEELTTFTYGHFGVVPLVPDATQTNMGAFDWYGKTPPEVFDMVKADQRQPMLIVNHPSNGDFMSYFSYANLNHTTGSGTPGTWSNHFDAVEVFNQSDFETNRQKSVADYFSLLNQGQKVWAVGSSDSHHIISSPVGYPRTCLYFGHDDPTQLTPNGVRDATLSGMAVVDGGLFLGVKGPNGEGPGQTATLTNGKASFTITVQAPTHIQAATVETIVNGVTISTDPLVPATDKPAHGNKWVNTVNVSVDPKLTNPWVIFHVKGPGDLAPLHPTFKPFAMSNPIWLK